jgi:hypothetical protein
MISYRLPNHDAELILTGWSMVGRATVVQGHVNSRNPLPSSVLHDLLYSLCTFFLVGQNVDGTTVRITSLKTEGLQQSWAGVVIETEAERAVSEDELAEAISALTKILEE